MSMRVKEKRGRRAGRGPGGDVRRAARALLWTALAVPLAPHAPGALVAQEKEEQKPLPRIPAGVTVSVLPAQSMEPLLSGAWPGGARGERDAVERMNAELDFAISESRTTADWTSPGEAVRRVRRNPLAGVEPTRLAVGGLAAMEPGKDQLYEPLHSQLRRLSALLGSRLVIVPVSIHYEADTTRRNAARWPDRDPSSATRRGGDPAGEAAVDSAAETYPGAGAEAAAGHGAGPEDGGRAVMTLAIVDTRARRLIWYGRIEGPPTPPGSPASLASLASRLIEVLAPS